MSNVELIYDADCPNVEAAREQLRRAFREAGQPAEWQEWDRGNPSSPAHARLYGSPSILVDGRDVAGASPAEGADSCRLYGFGLGGLQGVPPVEAVVSALRNGDGPNGISGGWPSWLATIPALGISLLPNLACPACWPAYAGLLSSVGLGVLMQAAYLLPLTVAFLVAAVGTLGIGARNRHAYGPFVVGILAAGVVIVGKFEFRSDPAMYGGIALLIGASVWNTWPKQNTTPACSACAEERETV